MSDYLNVIVSFKGKELARYSFSKSQVIVGRGSDADVFLDNAGVSREHARISVGEAGMAITDLQSNNGTFVNGASVDRSPLTPGDNVRIGKFSLDIQRSGVPLTTGTPGAGGPADSEPAPSAAPANEGAAPGRGTDAVGSDHTVIISAQEKQRVLQDKPLPPPIPKTPEPRESSPLLPFIAGMAVGALLAWLFL